MKQFGAFTLDTVNECLWRGGQRILLPPKPFAVLRYLVEHPGRLVSHDELLDALWPETYVQPQVLRTYMLDLRKILDDDARNPRFIQSIPKRGYCFVADVTEALQTPLELASGEDALSGRDRELAVLHAAMQRAAGGTRQVVFVCGESGIGKTALLDHFSRRLEHTHTVMVARGQCVAGIGGKQDYYPISDALRQLGKPPLHFAAPPGEVCAVLEQIAGDQPFVLLIEDLQWADETTLGLLSALARRRGSAKLLIAATQVPQTGSTGHAVNTHIFDLRMRRLCTEIELGRLGRTAIAEMIEAHLKQASSLPHGLSEFIYEHSEGNPRFAIAILEHLIAERVLSPLQAGDTTLWELRGPLVKDDAATPGELARMVELEIEHLTPHQQNVLEAASLVPVAFAAWLVAAALDEEVATVEECCDELTRHISFVKRAGEDELPDGTRSSFYVFAHAFYRDVLYRRQSPARRGARHTRVAERLRRLFQGREELIAREAAMHYEAAGNLLDTISMLNLAARRAIEMQAYVEAAELHQQMACLGANLPDEAKHELLGNGLRQFTSASSPEVPHRSVSSPAKA